MQPQSKGTRVFSVSGDIQAAVVNKVFSTLTHALQDFVDAHKNGCPVEVRQKWADEYASYRRLEGDNHLRKPTVQLENLKFDVLLNLLAPPDKNAHEALIKHWNQYFTNVKTGKATKHLNDLRALRNNLSGHQNWENASANFTSDHDVVRLFDVARNILEVVGECNEI